MSSKEQLKAIRKEIETNVDMREHLLHLLRNTKYKGTYYKKLPDEALIQAFRFANTNKIAFEEKGIPLAPMFKECFADRARDIEFVSIWNRVTEKVV